MAGNPFDQFDQTNSIPLSAGGYKPPSGYGAPGGPPIVPLPGGPEDPQVVARLAAARAAPAAAIDLRKDLAAARGKAQIELSTEAAKRDLKRQKTPDELAAAQWDLLNVIDQAQAAKKQAGSPNTGFVGDIASHIPGTPAYDLGSTLSTIGSNTAFDRLQRMRQESPTGAAVGNASDADMRLLKDSVAALSQGQSADKFTGNLNTVINRYTDMYRRLGGDMSAFGEDGSVVVEPYSGRRRDGQAPTIGGGAPGEQRSIPGAPLPGGRNPPAGPPPGGPIIGPSTPGGEDQFALAKGDYRTEVDPALAGVNAKISDLLRTGASADQVRSYLREVGVDPAGVQGIDDAVGFRQKNPAYRGNYPVSVDKRQVPMSPARSTLTRLGQGPVGAWTINAADAISAGTLDNMTDNPALTRAGMSQIAADNPTAAIGGMVAGGALAGGALEGTLGGLGVRAAARLPGALGIAPRAMAADALYGGAYGAGSADDGNRFTGALTGAVLGIGGGAIGRRAAGAIGGVIAPTGGRMAPAFAEGVRPTIGQRLAGTGTIGNTVNTMEQALQSVPIVGGIVRGARQSARDQFERGGFNSALREIGQQLPDDVPLGTQPHAYMQSAFNDAYDRARSGMSFVPDQQYGADQQAFVTSLGNGVLDDRQADKVLTILDRALTSRLQMSGGALTGDAYKAAYSDIGKAVRKLSGSEPVVADALSEFQGIFEGAARRSSSPDAVAAMEAADRGYAQAVRIEQAAAARGGDTGRFSPTQFDRSVQKASGGVRSRAYLRGDALMGDYADAGKGLVDTLPDSGTALRGLTAGALLGAGAKINPYVAAAEAGALVPYLPGVRRVVGGAMAPRQSARLQAVGDAIRDNRALVGRIGAPLAIARAR